MARVCELKMMLSYSTECACRVREESVNRQQRVEGQKVGWRMMEHYEVVRAGDAKRLVARMYLRRGRVATGLERRKGMESALRLRSRRKVWRSCW